MNPIALGLALLGAFGLFAANEDGAQTSAIAASVSADTPPSAAEIRGALRGRARPDMGRNGPAAVTPGRPEFLHPGQAPVARPAFDGEAIARAPLVRGRGGMMIPVVGVHNRHLTDTFTASRSGGRVHNAIDIMAARGTPVVAAISGTVERLHQSRLGGITAYVRSEDGQWVQYYAHLDRYAPGLTAGQRIEQGDLIGYVGYTGNASPSAPHLHFAVYRMAPGQRWYQGDAVNPFPMLRGASEAFARAR